MKIQIDLKSVVIGLMIGIGAMLAVGAGEPANTNGRYQISTGSGLAMIVDTQTGQAWSYNSGAGPRNDGNFFSNKNQ